MSFFDSNEKTMLIVLISIAIFLVILSTYLAVNQQKKNTDVICENIKVINIKGKVESTFQETYTKYGNNVGKYDMRMYDSPTNSLASSPSDWNYIADDIGFAYDSYDAFMVVCEHDILPYVASALSFMLENLSKPVIFTDQDVAPSLLLASKIKIPEVMVINNGKLLRACRTISVSRFGFSSPNYAPLSSKNGFKLPKEKMKITFINPQVIIGVIKLFPGISGKDIQGIVDNTPHGIVLETWRDEISPAKKSFFDAIDQLIHKGVIIIAVGQSPQYGISYQSDPYLIEKGILSGLDMTIPAAYAKLAFLLSNIKEKDLIGKLVGKSFRGELTNSSSP